METQLKALIEIITSLGKALALDQVLPQVFKSLFRIFLQADLGFIVLRNDEGEFVRGSRRSQPAPWGYHRISRTIVRRVMDSREAILLADASRDQRLDPRQSNRGTANPLIFCRLPLLDSEGQALGVIQLDTLDQRKRFRQEDLEVLAHHV